MRVGHREGGVDDAGQTRDIADLLEDLVIHFGKQALIAIEHGGHAHRTLGSEAPLPIRNFE